MSKIVVYLGKSIKNIDFFRDICYFKVGEKNEKKSNAGLN